jgi:diacylglycerol O-acyltransferase / wax synthase
MSEKFGRFLGPVDMAFYYTEASEAPMNIGSVSIFEGKISFEEFVRTVDTRIHRAPIYQQKIVQAPLNLGQPMWIYDPDFHIGNHVFRVPIDDPGDDEALRRTASRLMSSTLDRDKPLWEIYMIDGLQGDRSAFFFKVHHCMVDGLAAVELFTLLFDLSPDIPPLEEKPVYDPPPPPSTFELLMESARMDIPYKWNILKKIGNDVGNLLGVLQDKESRRKALVGAANLVNDNLQLIRKLPINGKNSGNQEISWVEFSLAEVRAIKSNRGTSVNDVMLTVLSGAIERYAADHMPDVSAQDFVRMLVPVSMRLEREKGDFGNRIAVMPVDIPFETGGALERLDAVKQYTQMMKESTLSNGLDMVLTMPSLAPSAVQPLIWSAAPIAFSLLAHMWCTNVAGPMIPVYFQGHKLVKNYGYFPLNPSMGLACVVLSYNQRISMTLVADKAIVPDVTILSDYLKQSYEELRAAAKVEPMDPIDIQWDEKATLNSNVNVASPNNGTAAVAVPVAEAVAEDEEAPSDKKKKAPEKLRIFTDPWAKAYKDVLNNSKAYYEASTKWKAGPLALVLKAEPRYGYDKDVAILLDLDQGKCNDAREVPPAEAEREAAFVIEGKHANWIRVLNGEAQPLGMLIRGKLKLKKGALTRLMPFTQSAQELIKCAQDI